MGTCYNRTMDPNEITFTWKAPEYEHKKKKPDWFWAVGIIAVAGAVTAIILGNVLFAILIALGAFVTIFLAAKHPENVDMEVNAKGIKVGNDMYPYDNVHAFNIIEHPNGHQYLIVQLERAFVGIVTIHIDSEINTEELREYLSLFVPEDDIQEPLPHKITKYIGF